MPSPQSKFIEDFYCHARISVEKDTILADFLNDLLIRQQENSEAILRLHKTFKEGGDYANLQEFIRHRVLMTDRKVDSLSVSVNALTSLLSRGPVPPGATTGPATGRVRSRGALDPRLSGKEATSTAMRSHSNAPSPTSTVYDFASQEQRTNQSEGPPLDRILERLSPHPTQHTADLTADAVAKEEIVTC